MRLPKKLVIAGHVIKIKYARGLVNGEHDCWGVYNDTTHTIYLKTGMDRTRKEEILLHECIHAIEHIHALSISEKAVKILAIEILGMLRNNQVTLCRKKSKGI